jgi:hypothetical protein
LKKLPTTLFFGHANSWKKVFVQLFLKQKELQIFIIKSLYILVREKTQENIYGHATISVLEIVANKKPSIWNKPPKMERIYNYSLARCVLTPYFAVMPVTFCG